MRIIAFVQGLTRIALEGYSELKQGNYHKADSLFKQVSNLTCDCELHTDIRQSTCWQLHSTKRKVGICSKNL
jgi:hypothetical protein